MKNNFLPTNKEEMEARGWKQLDIIIISGDAYVDHPSFGAAIVGRYLESLGYKVGIIAQPDWNSDEDFLKLGQPSLFAGVTAGNIDSMLAHYTANKKIRSDDAYTPGNIHGKRPNRATIVYTNKVRQLMPGVPIIIGGIEASLRRLAHYDYWSEKVRRSILLDSKADILVYGMGEAPLKVICTRLKNKEALESIRGTAVSVSEKNFNIENIDNYIILPTCEEVISDKEKFIEMTLQIDKNINPHNAKTLIQKQGTQYVIVNPPSMPLETNDLDKVYNLPFTRLPHPSYRDKIPAFDMIKDSITILRGCPGGCSFCSLGLHQGKIIKSRSEKSILDEIQTLSSSKDFKGIISDLGGPSANVYRQGCKDIQKLKNCKRPSCLYPQICENFDTSTDSLIQLMKKARTSKGIKKVHISSGIRHDVAIKSPEYISELVKYHVPGHLKLAPEHFDDKVLKLMRKPSFKIYEEFSKIFLQINKNCNKKQYILPYLISSFPGCTLEDMKKIGTYLRKNRIKVEQVQDFIPLPMTVAAAMYYTEKDIFSGKTIFVAKKKSDRDAQKNQLLWWK